MFTGLITATGTIAEMREDAHVITCPYAAGKLQLGESIAINGACLTLTHIAEHPSGSAFMVQLSPETLRCTAPRWQVGEAVNLERALAVGERLGGHFVTGHVDGMCHLQSLKVVGEYTQMQVKAPQELARFIAPKGSITLDGVSLTVNAVAGEMFDVMLIPHTLKHTTLGLRSEGDMLNMEIDLLARYVARLKEAQP